jgi:hypothetical protein
LLNEAAVSIHVNETYQALGSYFPYGNGHDAKASDEIADPWTRLTNGGTRKVTGNIMKGVSI